MNYIQLTISKSVWPIANSLYREGTYNSFYDLDFYIIRTMCVSQRVYGFLLYLVMSLAFYSWAISPALFYGFLTILNPL